MAENKELLAIICVVKNDDSGLKRTMDSIQTQTNHSCEVIIVSADEMTPDIGLPSFRYQVLHRKPEGIYDAMNFAVLNARSEFVWFLNAGDVLMGENSLEEVMKILHNNESDLIAFSVGVLTPSGFLFDVLEPVATESDGMRFIDANHQGTISRRSRIIDLGLFDTNLAFAADSKMQDMLIQNGRFAIQKNSLFSCFVLGGRSLMNFSKTQSEIKSHRNVYRISPFKRFKSSLRIYFLNSQNKSINKLFSIYCIKRQRNLMNKYISAPWLRVFSDNTHPMNF
jgi:glycosyltransferase involved in cell wall biosynthesis